jgi:hypothetical protein
MKNRAPILLLAVAVAASAVLLFSLDSHLTFISDSWVLLVKRQGWSPGTLLDPFNEHLVLAPTLVYKGLIAVFGMDSALPFYAVSISLFLLSAVLLFVYLRRRIGEWPALIASILILFLGAASEDLLWEFQMGFFGSIAAGLGMLIALDRESRRADQIASGLLVVSLAFSSMGVAFVAAGLADLALGRHPRRHRLYITLLPAALYALWWLGWGQSTGSNVSLQNLEYLPRYVLDAAAAGIASLLGREPVVSGGHPPVICQVLTVVLVVAAAFRIGRQREISRGLAIALTLALVFWVLSGLDRTPDRYAISSRYQYPSAIFLLLIAAELLRGVRISRFAVAAMAVVTAGAVFGGVSLLQRDYENTWKPMADEVRLTLAAVDIAGDSARPDFPLTFPPSVVAPTGSYLAGARAHGSPAFDEAELLARPEPERQTADVILAKALGFALDSPAHAHTLGCRTLFPAKNGRAPAELQPGTFVITATGRADTQLRLGRFADGFPVALGQLPSAGMRALQIPVDGSSQPWRLSIAGGSIRFCPQAPARDRQG